jgi:hypothetical protein
VHLGSYVCQVKTNDISFFLKCDFVRPYQNTFNSLFRLIQYYADALAGTAKFDGVLLKSPNIDMFGVSVVGSIEKSSPTFVVGQQVPSCSHIDATTPRNPLNVYPTLPFYHTPSPLSMPLNTFIWNGLYAGHLGKRRFARRRIVAHYERFGLMERGAEVADIRYVSSQTLLFH